jgi:23S rRNA (cytidine1920-2'-O)/16S rRNA (cytidine1409-2'-O)-methyltransferase
MVEGVRQQTPGSLLPCCSLTRGVTPWSLNWYILGTVSPSTKPATGARDAKPPRLDLALVERSLASTRERARALIMAGVVRVDGETERRPARPVPPDRSISIDEPPRFVSRGGLKLERALGSFALDVTGKVCLDAGASTGGFVDCLLQRGATRVYAVDVGYGQLDWRLREDPRVVVMERVNARYLESLPEPIDLFTADVSFISLRLILPALRRLGTDRAPIVTLIKPQFEAGRDAVGKGGVVRDAHVHAHVLKDLADWGRSTDQRLTKLDYSPVRGPAGNIEFLGLWLRGDAETISTDSIHELVQLAHGSLAD